MKWLHILSTWCFLSSPFRILQMRAKILHKFFKNSDLNHRNNQHLTKIKLALVALISQGNILFCHTFLQHSTFYIQFSNFLHSTPSWYQFLYQSNFQHVIGDLINSLESSQGTFYTSHIEHSISIFLKYSMSSILHQ